MTLTQFEIPDKKNPPPNNNNNKQTKENKKCKLYQIYQCVFVSITPLLFVILKNYYFLDHKFLVFS